MKKLSSLFIKTSFFTALIPAFLFAIIISDKNQSEPSFGLFVFFNVALVSNLLFLYFNFNKNIKFSAIAITSIVAFLMVNLGFLLSTKVKSLSFLFLMFLIIFININLILSIKDELITRYLYLIKSYILSKTSEFFNWFYTASKLTYKKTSKTKFSVYKMRRALLTALIFTFIVTPVLCIVLPILSSANQEFADTLNSLFNFSSFDFGRLFVRLTVFIFAFIYILSELIFTYLLQYEVKEVKELEVKYPRDISASIGYAFVALIFVLNLFYLLFIYKDLGYDFGNLRELVLKNDLDSYSQLAVSRFAELIFVVLINTILIYFGRKHIRKVLENIYIKYLSYGLIALMAFNSLMLLLSTYKRLEFYISAYGFTIRRFESFSFLPFVLVIVLLISAGFFVKNYQKFYVASISLLIFYIGFILMIPTTYVVTLINYNLEKNNAITVYDPTYSLPLSYYQKWEVINDLGDNTPEGKRLATDLNNSLVVNDINDIDGAVTVYQILNDSSININDDQRKFLEDLLEDAINKANMTNNMLTEFNFMRKAIQNL